MKRIEEISEIKRIQLDILSHVDCFCREYGIKYFLSGGTAIGAVRHKGYIPWDDDIDIMMLRADYDRFIYSYIENDKSVFKLHAPEFDRNYFVPFVKIDNSLTIIEENVNTRSSMGINIDVFPIDELPEDPDYQTRIYRRVGYLMKIYYLKQIEFNRKRSFVKNVILGIGRLLLVPIPLKKITRMISDYPKGFSFPDSKYCGAVVWGYGKREINLRSNFDDVLYCDFEQFKFPLPIGYDNYLRSVYGDYMKLPPEEKRVSHHSFQAFWK